MRRIVVGRPRRYSGVSVFPLSQDNGHEPAYMLLAEALEKHLAEVTEVDEGGSVPEVTLHNRCDKPLLIPEGEILVGAKQNRVVNVTILVAANSIFTLPVSCVEQGRWEHVSPRFRAAAYAHPRLRAMKSRSVQEQRTRSGMARSDQGEVWNEVERMNAELGVDSESSSLTDGLAAAEEQRADLRREIKLPKKASGFLVSEGDRVIGMDLFDSPKTLASLWPRLSAAYFAETGRQEEEGREATKKAAKVFINKVAENARPCERRLGLGHELEIAGEDIVGAAVYFEDKLCHLSAFAVVSE